MVTTVTDGLLFGRFVLIDLNGGKRGDRLVRGRPGLGDGQCRTCVRPRWNRCGRRRCTWLCVWYRLVRLGCIHPWQRLRLSLPIGPWRHRCGSPSRRSWKSTWAATAEAIQRDGVAIPGLRQDKNNIILYMLMKRRYCDDIVYVRRY